MKELTISVQDLNKIINYINAIPTLHGRPLLNFMEQLIAAAQKEAEDSASENLAQNQAKPA